jgi:protein SCO1/2
MALVGMLSACQPYQFKGTLYSDPQPAPDFVLTRSDGSQLRLSELKGRVVLIFFGFTSCPEVCPITLSDAKRILNGLGKDANNLAYLFITVDPERDTPEALEKYVKNFHPAILGLTGTPEELAVVYRNYDITVNKVPLGSSSLGYTVEHTARSYVVDSSGNLRLTYAYGMPYQSILDDVRQLLKEVR